MHGVGPAVIAADSKGSASSNALTFHQLWRKSEEDRIVSSGLLQLK